MGFRRLAAGQGVHQLMLALEMLEQQGLHPAAKILQQAMAAPGFLLGADIASAVRARGLIADLLQRFQNPGKRTMVGVDT
jgi:hypothetical protein